MIDFEYTIRSMKGDETMIRKQGSKYVLYSHDGSKKLGTFSSRAAAVKHEQQVQYFKHQGKK